MSNLLTIFENDAEAVVKFVESFGAGWFVQDRDIFLAKVKAAFSADVQALSAAAQSALVVAGDAAGTAALAALKSGANTQDAAAAALAAAEASIGTSGQQIEATLIKTTVASVMATLSAPAPAAP